MGKIWTVMWIPTNCGTKERADKAAKEAAEMIIVATNLCRKALDNE